MTNFLELEDIPAPGTPEAGGYVVDDQSWLGSALGTTSCESIMLDGALCLQAFPNGIVPSGTVLGKVTATGKYAPYGGTGEVSANEVQSITVSNANGGTFRLVFQGEYTSNIAYNATAATIQAALLALPDLASGDVTVSGGPASTGAVVVTFGGRYVGVNVPQLGADNSGLVNTNTSDHPNPSITISTTTQGNRPAGTDGTQTPVGHLFTVKNVTPRGGAVRDVSAALFWNGKVVTSKLPPNSGYDANVKSTLTRIRYV